MSASRDTHLTLQEAADLLKVSAKTIRRLLDQHRIPFPWPGMLGLIDLGRAQMG